MAVFVDTSAVYALLNREDEHHVAAQAGWTALRDRRKTLVTSNYVLLETIALVGRRMGLDAVRDFQTAVVPLLHVTWVDESVHDQAMGALMTAGKRELSLVDCVSFVLMRRLGLETAFTFDTHFAEQGFECLPAGHL